MLSCRELVEQTDALLAGDLSWHRRLALRLHIAMCHHCRRYVAQYRRMVGLLPQVCDRAEDAEVAEVLARVKRASKDDSAH